MKKNKRSKQKDQPGKQRITTRKGRCSVSGLNRKRKKLHVSYPNLGEYSEVAGKFEEDSRESEAFIYDGAKVTGAQSELINKILLLTDDEVRVLVSRAAEELNLQFRPKPQHENRPFP